MSVSTETTVATAVDVTAWMHEVAAAVEAEATTSRSSTRRSATATTAST